MKRVKKQTTTYVSKDRWITYRIFNPNAYPQNVKPIVEACSERAAILRFQVKNIRDFVKKDRDSFFKRLMTNKPEIMKTLIENPESNLIIYYEGLGYLSCLYGIFNMLKSFLDIYANLITKLISPKQAMSFKRANVGNSKLSGGKLIKWLKKNAPKYYKKNEQLSEIIAKHSESWISKVVMNYRDRLNHYGEIQGLNHMHVDTKDFSNGFREDCIKDPVMPEGTEVVQFCLDLLIKLEDFLKESLIILPNVKREFIRFDPQL